MVAERFGLPLLLSVLCATGVGLLASSVDTTYEATASVRIYPLIGVREIDRLRAAAGLDRVEERQHPPFVPADRGVMERVLRRVNLALRPDTDVDEDDVTVLDTESLLVFPKFKPPERRLTATVRASSSQQATRGANLLLATYLDERRRTYAGLLAETRRRLLERIRRPAGRADRPRLLEAAEATRVISELEAGLFTRDRVTARPPKGALLPNVPRDVIVAALIGALTGWLLQQGGAAWRGPRARPAPPLPSRQGG